MTEIRRVSCRIYHAIGSQLRSFWVENGPQETSLLHIILLVLLVHDLIGVLKTWLVLVRVGRHETLDGEENRL